MTTGVLIDEVRTLGKQIGELIKKVKQKIKSTKTRNITLNP